MRSNCIIFALALWWRRFTKGHEGHVSFRKSRWGYFPHMVYWEYRRSGAVRAVSYKPIDPSKRILPPPLFRGYVAWGDSPWHVRPPPVDPL